MRKLAPAFDRIIIQRNESFLHSAWLGLLGGFFYGPSTFWEVVKEPAMDVVMGITKLVVGLVLWLLVRIFFLYAGVFGMVSLADEVKRTRR